MRMCALAAVAVVTATAFSSVSAAQADVLITISKAQQRVAVSVDGAEMYRWPVSTGRRGYDTPVGQFRPVRLERDWYSRKYDWAPMPHSVFFYKGYAMHGTTEEKNLGRVASHGCVRLSRSNAATLFALLRERRNATRIVVTNASLPAGAPSPFLAKAEDEVKPVAAPVKLAATGPIALPAIDEQAPPKKVSADEPKPRPRVAARDTFASVGDEATVLRGREAWLRSLDRKYGITR